MLLSIRQLSRPGLEPVDLDLDAGECIAVSGPSGAGKSILLRAIADLDLNTGALALDGVDRDAMPAPHWRRQVGYLPAESGWWADRVGDHFPDREAAAAMLESLGLAPAALDWPVSRLSTGERQRLALARLLLVGPRVLLLDEPTSGLDPAAETRVEESLRARLKDGAAIIIVTHDPVQAARLTRRHYIIEAGRLHEAAS